MGVPLKRQEKAVALGATTENVALEPRETVFGAGWAEIAPGTARSTEMVPAPLLATTASGRPSPSRSPAATAVGEEPTGNVMRASKAVPPKPRCTASALEPWS